jgi:SM-20-related protein
MTIDSPHSINTPSEQLLDTITQGLRDKGYVVIETFLPALMVEALYLEAKTLSPVAFNAAGVGRNAGAQLNSKIRSDRTLWLSEASDTQKQYLSYMEALRLAINRQLFLGLFDFESHYSHYRKGDFYQKHLDAFKGGSNRILSSVLYLNPEWQESDGGHLALYQDSSDAHPQLIAPVCNRCVIFLSDTFPHEVRVSQADRYSIAGWFRVSR